MGKEFENVIYGESLQEIRKKNHYTQEDASQLTGLESKYISQIECGVAKGTIDTMLKFCEAYNVTPNDILYKFIKGSKALKDLNKLTNDFSKLNKRDKQVVLDVIKALLNN